jgi:hypothetical protein
MVVAWMLPRIAPSTEKRNRRRESIPLVLLNSVSADRLLRKCMPNSIPFGLISAQKCCVPVFDDKNERTLTMRDGLR